MKTGTLAGASRRELLGAAAAVVVTAALEAGPVAAQGRPTAIKAVAFDAFAIFDARPVVRMAEEMFPGHGAALSDAWRTRQFEYTWLRNSMDRYMDFWHVTQDALNYASKLMKVTLTAEQSARLMSAYLELKAWPDVAAVLEMSRKRGMRLALLSNMTPAMMKGCVKASGLQGMFELQLSTDRVKAFKPDPAAYAMGTDAFHLEPREIAFVAFGAWDAAGAKAFGYPTYWANRLDVPVEELGVCADVTAHDLVLLPKFIDSLQNI